jgi:hypothetical protein
MSFGRAMLLGLALASAVAAQLAADPVDRAAAAPASLTPTAESGDGAANAPPVLAIAVTAPALPAARIVASTTDRVPAPPRPAPPPLWFAPKTSPPQT